DDQLPVYLRGMDWHNAKEYQKEDLRLSNDVLPLNYNIELSVNIRGYEAASRSDFNGTVVIELKTTKEIDKIELHSNGLSIFEVHYLALLPFNSTVGVTNVSSDSNRETVTVHLNKTVEADRTFMLLIRYRGVAKVDEYGLYNAQSANANISTPYVLSSNNFPTGARFW
ncbi:hypothetical protein PFISCL1PPCAC_21171, partial [Pristionchus fissidentatus]